MATDLPSNERVLLVGAIANGESVEIEKVEPRLRDMYGGGVILRLRHEAGDIVLSVDLDIAGVEQLVSRLESMITASHRDYQAARA